MDEEFELKRFRWLIISGIVFLFSAYWSLYELRFLIWGARAEATVLGIKETQSRPSLLRASKTFKTVEYSFTDPASGVLVERDRASKASQLEQNPVPVEYLPGVKESSRLLGNNNARSIWIFVGNLVWFGCLVYRLAKEANEPYRRKRR